MKVISSQEHSNYVILPKVWCCNWNYKGTLIASCGENKAIKIWSYSRDKEPCLKLVSTISGEHIRTIRYVCFSPCGRYLASASFDASIIIYEYKDDDFVEVHKLEGHENEVKCCQFSTSGEFLATCSRDKTVWIWQVDEDNDYEVASILQNHTADVKFIAWHPTEDILVSGGYDCSIRFYNFDGEDWVTQQAIPDAHENTVWSGSFNANGTYLATCSADSCIKVWKKESGISWTPFITHKVFSTRWSFNTIGWNHLNGLIAVAGDDCILRIYAFDEENMAISLVNTIQLEAEINSISWNPKIENLIVSALDNGNIELVET